ncbi:MULTISPECIES: HD domain-containing phosphohydrolase [unclassified Massilia]|uniref:HD domain-containing phosphohydrolase n=1 Tax=unclassified Massilia TaxID=2609279 RepID=UPI0017876DFD|nr:MULTISPECIES: HD domain-containing phosphohydrolase [unclassified Massilia]MBD8531731.1 HD domain-containing protein [Massilia sp. CFBP 13647]MBD8675176.1 HD domain-containing protein [Massilia sp. CFBP 13721]
MHANILNDLDFTRHARWLRRITGVDYDFAVCGADGSLAFSSLAGSDVGAWIASACAAGFTWPCVGDGMQRHDGDGATLLYMAIHGKTGLLGYLAVRVATEAAAPTAWDALAETFEDIGAGIADEAAAKRELDNMALELSERYEELHLVYAIDKTVQQLEPGADLFQRLLQSWAEHMDADVAAFVKPGENLCVHATNLSAPIHNLDLVLVEMRGDLYRFTHSARAPIVINDVADPRRAYIFTDLPFKLLCCPVIHDRSVVAILVLANHLAKPDFSNSDRKLGELLANQLSGLSKMYGMLAETQKFNDQMANALIEAVEAKDPYTRGHSERVHYITMEIGKAMNLGSRDTDDLFWGSLLHDVGKIGIPDAVLCKPGRLTADEFTFIKVHPERSYEILRHIDRLKGAVPGARHHQEKYDGTGYPHGLKGNDIPLHARIIAVADTYDSITSSRAYRAGRSHEVAMAEISRVAGSQLDPAIIKVFEDVCALEPEWIVRFNIARDRVQEQAA